MAKLNIYVPDDLKSVMDGFEKQEPNWSGVAQEAFRLECGRLRNRQRSKGKMDTVIERLRASKAKQENEDRVRGHGLGRTWAREHAEYRELERLEVWGPFNTDEQQIDDWAWRAFAEISEDDRPSAGDTQEFWERFANERSPSNDFVLGFLEGAMEVLDEVQDKL